MRRDPPPFPPAPRAATRRAVALAVAGALATGLAAAQPLKLRPGLWEHQVTMTSDDGKLESAMAQMQQKLASMPPEQRRMVEEAMAKQGVGIGAKGNSVKVCLSQADVERDEFPRREGCTQDLKRSGNTLQVSFECKGPPPSSGDGQLTLQSPTAYRGEFTVRTVVQGKPQQTRMSQAGQWQSADCGGLKPLGNR